MMLTRRSALAAVAVLALVATAIAACVGDDPAISPVDPGGDGGSNPADASGSNDGQGGGDGAANDGGGDASDGSITMPCNAAVPQSDPGNVQCATDAGCKASSGSPVCCYGSTVNLPSRCYTAGATCAAFKFQCDKSSDCTGAEMCCLTGSANGGATCPYKVANAAGSKCMPADAGCAAATSIQLCTAMQTCADPSKKCHPVTATVTADVTFTRELGGCFAP